MSDVARKLLEGALALPQEDRAHIAAEVIASLDDPPSVDWEATWLADLDRRLGDAQRVGETGTDCAEVRAALLAELRAE